MKLNVSKPWWVPGWIWNRGVSTAADYIRDAARVDRIAAAAGEKMGDLLEKAAEGKDPVTVGKCCANCRRAGELFTRAASAMEDGEVTPEERAEIADALAQVVWGFISQNAIDAKIDEVVGALRV